MIWYFPMSLSKGDQKRNILRDILDKSKRIQDMKSEIKSHGYDNSALSKNTIKSADIKAPLYVKFHEITNLSACFSRADLLELPPNQKRYFPLSEIKTGKVFDIKSVLEKSDSSHGTDLNYTEFLKALYKKLKIDPNSKINVPVLLFVNCRLLHGLRLISTANSIFLPIRNNSHGYHDLFFPGVKVEDITLETRI